MILLIFATFSCSYKCGIMTYLCHFLLYRRLCYIFCDILDEHLTSISKWWMFGKWMTEVYSILNFSSVSLVVCSSLCSYRFFTFHHRNSWCCLTLSTFLIWFLCFLFLQDPPENAVVTICGHVFCFQCVSDYLTGEDTTCPESGCKQQLSADVIFSKAALQKCLSSDFDSYHANISGNDEKSAVLKDKYSSKIKAALDIIQSCCKLSLSSERNEMQLNGDASSSGNGAAYSQISRQTKAIVFSQWTSMLDLVEISLNSSGIEYRRLDGTMSLAARDRAVKEFNTNPEVKILFPQFMINWFLRFYFLTVCLSCQPIP